MAKGPNPKKRVWRPLVNGADRFSKFTMADVSAIKGLAAGTANEDQQNRSLMWIIEHACQAEYTSYTKGDPYETAFNEGRRFVGLEIKKLMQSDMEILRRIIDA